MNKLDFKGMQFSASLEFMAVDKKNGTAYPVSELKWDQAGKLIEMKLWCNVAGVMCSTGCILSEFHPPCGFTGYTDSKGEEMYGGHFLRSFGIGIGIVCWRLGTWLFYDIKRESCSLSEDWSRSDKFTIIGHIHIPSEWPKEVKALLKKGETT